MPPFLKSAEFWKAVSLIVAVVFSYFVPDHAVQAAMVEAFVYALLKLFFNVVPELRARGLIA